METLFSILEKFGRPLSLITLCSSTFGFFVFIENMSAPQARTDFARYLKSTDFATTFMRLPTDTYALFERVFGVRHFSWRCVKASIIFSAAAFSIMVTLNILNNPRVFFFWVHLMLEERSLLNIFIAYAVWSMVPDYFNLFKTRKVLDLITTHRMNRPFVLGLILVADFVTGYVIFIVGCLPIGMFSLHLVLYLLGAGGVDWHHVVSNFGFQPLPIRSAFELPYDILFWSGMVPSIWLWLYVGATLIVRVTARAGPVFRFSIYFLDIDEHPIRSIGIVAAALVGCLYLALLTVWKFVELLSEAT